MRVRHRGKGKKVKMAGKWGKKRDGKRRRKTERKRELGQLVIHYTSPIIHPGPALCCSPSFIFILLLNLSVGLCLQAENPLCHILRSGKGSAAVYSEGLHCAHPATHTHTHTRMHETIISNRNSLKLKNEQRSTENNLYKEIKPHQPCFRFKVMYRECHTQDTESVSKSMAAQHWEGLN